jgi:nucleoside-diphosphate-sugar epimerase
MARGAGSMSRLVVVGLGYSARAIAGALASEGWGIAATSRTAEGAGRIAALGFEGLVFDGTRPSDRLAAALALASHVLVSAPPDDEGDPLLRHHTRDLRAAAGLVWVGYLSTIGVYGDRQGAWVDETAEPRPISDRSRRRLAAEEAWGEFARGCGRRVQIFRLAGIYGPGRSAIDDVRAGSARRIVKPGQVFNRIHVEDLAAAVVAGAKGRGAGAVYNLADDEPAPPQDVVAYAARLLRLPIPPEIPYAAARLSPMAQSFYAESKRVRNDKAKRELGLVLKYPTYREGLRSIAERPTGSIHPAFTAAPPLPPKSG